MNFSAIKSEIARYDALHATLPSGDICLGAQTLSYSLATMIAGYLNRHEDDFIAAHRDDLTLFCEKMVAFSPYYSSRRLLQGRFYTHLGCHAEAATAFREAYEIEKDTHYAWPHLQPRADNAQILMWLGFALCHTGQNREGRKYMLAGQDMENAVMAATTTNLKPEPR